MAKVDFEKTNETITEIGKEKKDSVGEKDGDTFFWNGATVVPKGNIRSSNFQKDVYGWNLNKNGGIEFNGNKITTTNFTLIFKSRGVSFYTSDGTTPNGNLSGTAGDVCFNGPSGQPFYCGGGTTWTGM